MKEELYDNIRDRFMSEINENDMVTGAASFRIINNKYSFILVHKFRTDIKETVQYWKNLFSKVIARTDQEYIDGIITPNTYDALTKIYLHLDIEEVNHSILDVIEEFDITPYWIIQTFEREGKIIKQHIRWCTYEESNPSD